MRLVLYYDITIRRTELRGADTITIDRLPITRLSSVQSVQFSQFSSVLTAETELTELCRALVVLRSVWPESRSWRVERGTLK